MSDIFLSYAREDKGKAAALAKVLADQGWSVWWDKTIPPGQSFDKVIETALNSAKCVIVLWSANSVASDWVKTEAAEGLGRKILVPVLIEDVTIPLEFRRIQAANLTDWDFSADHPELDTVFNTISDLIPRKPPARPGGEAEKVEEAEPGSPSADETGANLKNYKIFRHPNGQLEAVKQGWSWPAFFFSGVWLLFKKIWGLGLILCFFYLILTVIEVSFAGPTEEAGAVIQFLSVLIQLVIGVILGITGHTLREKNLLSRGFELKKTVAASNQEIALSRYLKSNQQS